MPNNERMEIGIDEEILEQARGVANLIQELGEDSLSFVPDKQSIGNKPIFHVSRQRGDLFILTSFDVDGETFYLGTKK